jgi:REP element-mobilizing transposase RayT
MTWEKMPMPQQPLIIAYHLIWTAYGYWLPNDPRGSTSHKIASMRIAELGELYYGRKSKQPASRELKEFKERAKEVLKFNVVKFGSAETEIIGQAFAEVMDREKYTCYSCAIMPDHIHLLIRKHKHQAEDMIENFQSTSREFLQQAGLRSWDHPVWGGPGWKVFLDHPAEIRRIIRYIEDNPIKWRLPSQHWPFVLKYDGWPLHPGHNPNSPYAKALRYYRPV